MTLLVRMMLVLTLSGAVAACGGGDNSTGGGDKRLTVTNETPCVIHVRFDNGLGVLRLLPGETSEYADERLDEYEFMQVESTMAIFRNFDMEPIRAAGYTLTVRPALEDNACVEEP